MYCGKSQYTFRILPPVIRFPFFNYFVFQLDLIIGCCKNDLSTNHFEIIVTTLDEMLVTIVDEINLNLLAA